MDLSRRLKEAVKPLQKSSLVQEIQEKLRSHGAQDESPDAHQFQDTVVPHRVPLKHVLKDPVVEEALFDSIDPQYYNEDFDPSLFELRKLTSASADGSAIPIELVNINRQVLEKQLAVVNNKVYEMITGKQAEYSAEVVHIVALQSRLAQCLSECVEARRALRQTQIDFTEKNLRVLQCTRRRNLLMEAVSKLSVIKTLHQTDIRLYELLELRDYPAAIQLLLECRSALQDYQQFDCMKQLSLKFDRTLEKTEQQLDTALSKLCLDYNEEAYSKLTAALTLLERGPNVLDQLLMHFMSAIHNLSLIIVAKHGRHGEPGKKQYAELCQAVAEDRYADCLRELGQTFFRLMVSYRQVLEWHETKIKQDEEAELESKKSQPDIIGSMSSGDVSTADSPAKSVRSGCGDRTDASPCTSTYSSPAKEKIDEKCLARQKLRNGLGRLWSDMQQKFKLLLSSFCWQTITEFDKFIGVLNTTKLMIQVGEVFCERSGCSADLEGSAEEQCLRYLNSYHSQSMATLRTYLEHESWELMPVRDGFSLDHLHEFCFLHQQKQNKADSNSATNAEVSLTIRPLPDCDITFSLDSSNPFISEVFVVPSDLDNSIFDDGGDEEDNDEKTSFYDKSERMGSPVTTLEQTTGVLQPRFPKHAMTNTSLTIFRLLGRYLNMMAALGGGHKITKLVLRSVVHLFEYYLHTIAAHFANEVAGVYAWSISPFCRRVLHRIADSLCPSSAAATLVANTPVASASPSGASVGSVLSTVTATLTSTNVGGAVVTGNTLDEPTGVSVLSSSSSTVNTDFGASPALPNTCLIQCGVLPPELTPLDDRPTNYYSLRKRVAACESLTFLSAQLQLLLPQVEVRAISSNNADAACGVNASHTICNGSLEKTFNCKTININKLDEQVVASADGFALSATPESDSFVEYHAEVNDGVSNSSVCESRLSVGGLSNDGVGATGSGEMLERFLTDAECARELYHAVYLAVSSKFIALPQLLESMATVNWDLRDIQTQHSPYVDLLLQQLAHLEHVLWEGYYPESVIKNIWIVTLRLCSQAFIEGFSSVKKCSNAGRALMQLDWQQFLSKVERMRVKLKPIPDQALVEALVRAFYLIEQPLEEWITTNGHLYPKKQLIGLINSMNHLSRRSRQSLIQMIEDQQR